MASHEHSIDPFRHDHLYLGEHHDRNARKTWAVIALCAAMMAAEVVGGYLFGSMALVADGLHMSTHAGALLIAALAYVYARRHALDERFAFGTGKLGELAAFSSALILAMIAVLIGYESASRLFHPVHIDFDEALPIAGLGLCVNLASAWLLRDDHGHTHEHSHDHGEGHHKHDLNMRAAYVHVIADAAVSVLAIIGLLAGREFGLVWMDPVMGLVGTLVIANWSWGLLRDAGGVLLDVSLHDELAARIKQQLEVGADRVADLHLWRLGPGHNAVIATLVTDTPLPASDYKKRLADIENLSHVTIEVEACPDAHANGCGS
ncbi:MAG TPA: CDF family Co(II)/Ni(II) efflux transporter DmeF [Rhizomicrobium sp.]|nr:CDF family Co(II)/Ni(II) efflux transporter DmeF [Rhizomicrobium sp.]